MRTTVIAGSGMGTDRAAAAAFLAACLAEAGDRVLAVDCTARGTMSALLHAPVRPGGGALADVLLCGRGLTEVGRPCGFDGGGLVSGGPALNGLDALLDGEPSAAFRLRRAIANLPDGQWDRVVIDTSEQPVLAAANALIAADEVVVPVAAGPQALATVRDAEQAIGRVRLRGANAELRLAGVVLVGAGGFEVSARTANTLRVRGTAILGVVSGHATWAEWRLVAMRLAATPVLSVHQAA
jgi:chromosome partitioning protein